MKSANVLQTASANIAPVQTHITAGIVWYQRQFIYPAYIVDSGKKFTAGVSAFITWISVNMHVTNVVVDTGGNFAADVSGTTCSSQFSADVVDRCCNLSGECFRKFREKIEMSLLELLGGQGSMIYGKILQSKISRHCPITVSQMINWNSRRRVRIALNTSWSIFLISSKCRVTPPTPPPPTPPQTLNIARGIHKRLDSH